MKLIEVKKILNELYNLSSEENDELLTLLKQLKIPGVKKKIEKGAYGPFIEFYVPKRKMPAISISFDKKSSGKKTIYVNANEQPYAGGRTDKRFKLGAAKYGIDHIPAKDIPTAVKIVQKKVNEFINK